MQEYLDEIESWMEQVRDEDTNVEDYNFLDRLLHGSSETGGKSNGVANVGAYLAIYEEDGELVVDEELVEELDRRQEESEEHVGHSRFQNIVYDATSKKREGKTLYEKGVDGHGKLEEMLTAFRENADYEDSPPPSNEQANKDNDANDKMLVSKTASPIPNGGAENSTKGGDNMVTDNELNDQTKRRRNAHRGAIRALTGQGATVKEAAEAADAARDAYLEAEGDLEEARDTLYQVLGQDEEIFGYAEEALTKYDEVLEDEVIDPLEDIDHDGYDLTRVRHNIRETGKTFEDETPDDPSDLVK